MKKGIVFIKKKYRGSALFIVILFIFFISTMIIGKAALLTKEREFVQKELAKLDTYISCYNGTQYVLNRMLVSSRTDNEILDNSVGKKEGKRLFLDGSKIEFSVAEFISENKRSGIPPDSLKRLSSKKIELSLQDTAGLLNPFKVNRGLLREFMKNHIRDRILLETIIDSILDWSDPDDLRRPNGAEIEQYQTDFDYTPPNRTILSKYELLLINGFTEELFNKVKDHLDFTPENEGLNINTVPGDLFGGIANLTTENITNFNDLRRTRPFTQLSGLNSRAQIELGGLGRMMRFRSSDTINVFIKSSDEKGRNFYIRSSIRKTEDKPDKKNKLGKKKLTLKDKKLTDYYKILSWEEGLESRI